MTTIFIVATGASSQAKPGDWSATNTWEVIGGGGGGAGIANANQNGGGGGGGYSKSTNVNATGATFFFSVGAGGTAGNPGNAGADTWARFDGTNAAPTTTAQGVLAKAGAGG